MTNWKFHLPRVAYLSGGGSGIGLGFAHALLAQGASVAIFDLQLADDILEQLRKRCTAPGQTVRWYPVDITDSAAVDNAMALAHSLQGAPELAFNCAGLMRNAVFTELAVETFEQVIRVNLFGSRNFAASALKYLKPQGHLVLMASLAGIVGSYTQSAYAASKFGVVGLAEVLRAEQKLCGIDVSVVCPGEIQTPLLTYERQHGSPVTRELNAVAGVLTVEQAVAGIMRGIQRRQFMITPGFKARLIRALGRKFSSLQRWIVDRNLARSALPSLKDARK
ncbi:D-beta-hydroxybutyrate dehydrogenase [compost metagenome]|uniref:SDR family NAD(P)-dependent oxidoreductase n=1 Tax=Pseudomonas TaxID=286 RepID=UPI00040C2BFC|nr:MULTISPECIES: SDR family NAD(P)-dependent oxidoreductase [Pseudomonas]MCW2271509.1 NAD(P)-dependent dehydrogenase (short-subunit alcohol dehydrogenase family) [Pseudomonas sp. JUb96]PRA71138.1 short-chain dehydrogenase [Pseudomonas sp. MYb187]